MSKNLPNNYHLKLGSIHDKARLFKFMELTYQELFPERSNFSHLNKTVEQYLSSQTPLWWIKYQGSTQELSQTVACLWMGTGVDQVSGDRYGHIFLVYVMPNHRRQGIATALIEQGKDWSSQQGYHQVGLQVFDRNQAAQKLYNKLGFNTQSHLMFKSWDNKG
jgi:ribosomal protein S18 acetylase RimI-like enzyme